MEIAVIGAGFTGLAASYKLTKLGHRVTVFEKEPFVGGLAHGFRPATRSHDQGWGWPLEAFYHHIFTNDSAIIGLTQEINASKTLKFMRPATASLLPPDNTIMQLDSAYHLLTFSKLPLADRLRTGMMLAFCKANPFWQPLEKVTAENFIKFVGGANGWKILWQPLLTGKFGPYASRVAASWFWARIKKRTPRLGYFDGGFQSFAETLAGAITVSGGKIQTGTTIAPIRKNGPSGQFTVNNILFDSVLLTTPSPVAAKLAPFPEDYKKKILSIPHLTAQILVLETKKPILPSVYWLNINDTSFPFLSVVAHTNFVDRRHYAGHHITYVGNYLPDNHPYLTMTKEQLLELFLPYIKTINPKSDINNPKSYVFTAPNAQPVHTLRYSQIAPTLKTPVSGLYLANMDSIYPWDRGTNYAVELGFRAAQTIHSTP